MADDSGETWEFRAQAEAVLDVVRATVIRLLLDGRLRPHPVTLAVARVAGELGASIAVAGGLGLERVLGELADLTRPAGREHCELTRLVSVERAVTISA